MLFKLAKNVIMMMLASSFLSCTNSSVSTSKLFSAENPWPEIRKKRISSLLPKAMEKAGVDVWIVVCRENDNDPIANHVGGENAGRTAAFVFTKIPEYKSIAFSPEGEASALIDLAIHDTVIVVKRNGNALEEAGQFIASLNPKAIAINSSPGDALADGLSHSQYVELQKHLGSNSEKTVSSQELIYQWLSVKLPEEIDIMKKAAEVTAQWEEEAYQIIEPGKTTDAEVAVFLKQKMADAGVDDAWAPDQNPNVNSGLDRGHSHATDKVINYGDVIQTDFGIKVYGMWVTDIQRFAYVLKPNEKTAPPDIQKYWDVAAEGSRKVVDFMKPGVKGVQVDSVQRVWMEQNGSLPVMWSTGHPVGYVAHDIGPGLGGGTNPKNARKDQKRPLQKGNVFAFDGFYTWNLGDGTKTISVEEMVHITDSGAEYLVQPQSELILIGN